jgi:hypothetical protein
MPRELKVFSIGGFANDPAGGRRIQCRLVVAAYSRAEALRLTGCTMADWRHNGQITPHPESRAVALSEPGTVFWQPLMSGPTDRHKWFRVLSQGPGIATTSEQVNHLDGAQPGATP